MNTLIEKLAKECHELSDHPQLSEEARNIHASHERRLRALIASARGEQGLRDQIVSLIREQAIPHRWTLAHIADVVAKMRPAPGDGGLREQIRLLLQQARLKVQSNKQPPGTRWQDGVNWLVGEIDAVFGTRKEGE